MLATSPRDARSFGAGSRTATTAPSAPPSAETDLTAVGVAATGAIAGLAILKLVMLAALFSRTEPYPPLAFAPLFAASLAASALVVALIWAGSRWFLAPTVLVILESLLSVGPQKLYPGESSFFAQSAAVYPVIVVGSALILVLVLTSRTLYRELAVPSRRRQLATPATAGY